jgi:two-component system, cell cycle sensor histidine kinase PleC
MSRTKPRITVIEGAGAAGRSGAVVPRGGAGPFQAAEPTGGNSVIQPEVAQLLTEGAPAYVVDTNGRITFANDAFRQLAQSLGAGNDAEEIGRVFPLHDVLAEILAIGGPARREDVHQIDGSVLYLRSEHRPLHDGQGRIVGMGGIFHDSSGEASAWLEALAARERFRDIARLVSDWLWETDAAFNLTYVSARATEILGLHARHLIGRNLFSLGTFRSKGIGAKPPSTNTRSPFRNLPFAMPSAAGEERLFELSGIPVFDDARGAFRGYRGTARDITAEAHAQEDAARSQRRLTAAIGNISEGFALWGRERRLSIVNPRFEALFAVKRLGIAKGMTFEAFLERTQAAHLFADGPSDAACWREARAQALAGRDGAATVRLADGRWLSISEHRTGEKQAVVTIATDITEIKAREEALVAAKDMAQVANRSKGDFLANMSHELRTPLNAIIGFSEIMDRGTFGPLGSERYGGYVRDIIRSSRHLLGIISDILETAKMEASKIDLDEEDVELAEDVRDTVQLLAEQAALAQLTLTVDAAPALPLLHGDRRRIRQIVINLVSNAIKFTPPGGRIGVALRHAPSGEITLTVADTGIGIAATDIAKVLAPFGQVEGPLNRRHEGTGLGLPLSKALAELHGGGLSIDSAPGQGTRVTVMFPQTRVRPA